MSTPNDQLFVYVAIAGEDSPVLAAKVDIFHNEFRTEFTYAKSYKARDDAYALDPINLPLTMLPRQPQPITRSRYGHLDGAIGDAVQPGTWNKEAIKKHYHATNLALPHTKADWAIAGSGRGAGAIFVSRSKSALLRDAQSQAAPPEFDSLDDLQTTAIKMHINKPVDPIKSAYFMPGAGLDGQHPKAYVKDNDKHYIVKFNSPIEPFNTTKAEYVTMQMAKTAGCETPDTKLIETPKGDVLAVERFDINKTGQRQHMITAHSLINKYDIREFNDVDMSYPNLNKIMQSTSDSDKQSQSEEIFRRMLVNVAISNTDDHLRNHAFIQDEEGFRLSPVYDVAPQLALGSQRIAVGAYGGTPTVDNIAQCAKVLSIDSSRAREISAQVLSATDDWERQLQNVGMEKNDIALLKPSFEARRYVEKYFEALPQPQLSISEFNKKLKGVKVTQDTKGLNLQT